MKSIIQTRSQTIHPGHRHFEEKRDGMPPQELFTITVRFRGFGIKQTYHQDQKIRGKNMNAKEIYKNYPKKVQEYMQNVIDCLKQDYKDIPTSWRVSLDLRADNVDIYLKAKQDIDENGLLRKDKQGRTFKNQCFPLMQASQDHIIKLL